MLTFAHKVLANATRLLGKQFCKPGEPEPLGTEDGAKGHGLYRPDIDGLRAVAVLPVVLFHADASVVSGGYVGVDVFFVISGFLITSIIVPEVERKSFSILTFYQRRIRRIFPALVVVLLFCIILGYFLLTPPDYNALGQSIVATAFFVSNIYFWQETGYFGGAASEKPLLHTWSLSIEEQFYLGYPFLLLVLARFSRATRNRTLVGVCLVSFGASALLVAYKPSATFFLGPTRVWELLVGALIACNVITRSTKRAVNNASALAGLILILVPMFTYSSDTLFPGLSALPPVFGTGLLIWSGLGMGTIFHRALSSKSLVNLGRASYSLYLWHLPLLTFARYCTLGPLNWQVSGAICLLSIAVAFLSLRVIEQPFRFPYPRGRSFRLASLAFVAMASAAAAGATIQLTKGFPSRLDAVSREYLDAEKDIDRHHMECLSLEERIINPEAACRFGAKNVIPETLLWGDSHAVITATALLEAAVKNDAAFYFAASVDCPIGIGFAIDAATGPSFLKTKAYQYCGEYNSAMLRFALQHTDVRTVVLSSRWSNWRIGEPGSLADARVDIRLRDDRGVARSFEANRTIFARGFERLIRTLVNSGKIVWIVGPLPEPMQRVPKGLYIKHLGFDNSDLDVTWSEFEAQHRWILSFFSMIAAKYPVHFIWPHSVLCNSLVCPVSAGGKPLFFDHNHLSIFGSQLTSALYNEVFTRPPPP